MKLGKMSSGRLFAMACSGYAALLAGTPAFAQGAEDNGGQTVISYSGVDVAKDSFSIYSGGMVALSGTFDRDGFVLRADVTRGEYDYLSDTLGNIDADERIYDVMIGYQRTIGVVTATGFIGFEHRDIDLSPNDPDNAIQGDESGFKAALDAETGDEIPLFLALSTSYSTAFDAFDAMLQVGYNMRRMVIGVEGSYSSLEGDESERLGGFATFRFNLTPTTPAELTVSAGHQFVAEDGNNTSGGEGTYGSVGISFSF